MGGGLVGSWCRRMYVKTVKINDERFENVKDKMFFSTLTHIPILTLTFIPGPSTSQSRESDSSSATWCCSELPLTSELPFSLLLLNRTKCLKDTMPHSPVIIVSFHR